jgi:hypothetical protein
MHILFAVAYIAIVLMLSIYICHDLNIFGKQPKSMLEQIAEAQLLDEEDYKGNIIELHKKHV